MQLNEFLMDSVIRCPTCRWRNSSAVLLLPIAASLFHVTYEIKNGMLDMEQRFTDQLGRVIGDMKEDLRVETPARQQLEERILHVEQNSSKKTTSQRMLAMKEKLTKQ